ncbi:MAG: 2-oxo acid dehydrogenase subunit E2 [Planctomycetes bacterium]|nr:2-oxo acid dehydrogenase subunit E2 [Planctomycetota bacterium]
MLRRRRRAAVAVPAAAPAPVAVAAAAVALAPLPTPASAPFPGAGGDGKVLATPATRRLALEMGIGLAAVEGTGPHGRVTREDVLRHAASRGAAAPAKPAAPPAPAAPPSPAAAGEGQGEGRSEAPTPPAAAPIAPGAREERIPFRGLRRKIADNMVRAKHTAAHFTYVDELEVSKLVALRNESKPIAEKRGVKLSYLPFVIKAVVAGLKEFPWMNATIDDAAGQIVIKKYYNIGIAVDTPDGLFVPVIKDADKKSILELARESERLAENARTGKSQLADLQGGTFTITSAGNIGGLFATPIINHPEVAILGVHQIKEKPVVKEGRIEIGNLMYLSISLDHRLVDGAMGARFMNTVIKYLVEPQLLLLESP